MANNYEVVTLLDNEEKTSAINISQGRMGNALSKAIAYERTPSLFDNVEIIERDASVRETHDLAQMCLERKGKPVVLTTYQTRVVYALSYAISCHMDEKDVAEKMNNPNSGHIIRMVDITGLSKLIFGSTRKRYKEILIREIYNLANTEQVQIVGSGDNMVKFLAPIVSLGRKALDLSPERINDIDKIEIWFGSLFFTGLNNRYAVITPKLFDVWQKKGRGTELFSVLLSSIYSVYWHYRQAAEKAEDRVRADKANKGKSKEELDALIADARRNAMTYELNVSSIKNRVTTDYESQRFYAKKFWLDLDNAIEGFKELGLITHAKVSKGAKGQEKVAFVLSEDYNFGEKDTQKLLTEHKQTGYPAF